MTEYPCQKAIWWQQTDMKYGTGDPLETPQTDVICGSLKYQKRIYGFFMLNAAPETVDLMKNILCTYCCPFNSETPIKDIPEIPGFVITSDLELRRKP